MGSLFAYTLVGLFTGAAYAIMASGLVLTYATTRVFNIAHGAFGMVIPPQKYPDASTRWMTHEVVAVAPNEDGREELYGIVRIAADPDNQKAEYAVMVRSDMKGKGQGYVLMTRIINYARSRGIGEVHGDVLRENTTMLEMCRDLGFTQKENRDEPGVVEVTIKM